MKKIIKIIFCFIILPFIFGCVTSAPRRAGDISGVTHDAAMLKVPANIDIMTFDGERVEIDYLPMYGFNIFRMTPGKHIILLRYSGLSADAAYDQKQMLYSPKVEVALNAEKKHEYLVRYEVPLVDLRFDKEIKSLTVWIEDAKTKTVVCAPVTSAAAAAKKNADEQQRQAASVPAESSGIKVLPPPQPSSGDDSRPPLEQLKRWWGKASASERGEFLKWSVMQK